MAAERVALEAETRLPRKDVPVVVYDAGEGLVALAADRCGLRHVARSGAWQAAGFEVFQDVNSYAKALANSSNPSGVRPRCLPTKSRRSLQARPISPCLISSGSTNTRP